MSNINFCKALNETMDHYGISGAWLAEKAGVSSTMISLYRNERQDIKGSSLEKIISALPPDSQDYYFDQINPRCRDLRTLILRCSKEEKAQVLEIIAKSLISGIAEREELPTAV